MATMVALVGDQPLPNFLPVQHYQPEAVLLVYTAKTQQKYTYLETTLQRGARSPGMATSSRVEVFGLITDPYDIPGISQALEKKLEQLSPPFIFNLTGGTKTMSLAAYQVAQQHKAAMIYLQSEGKHTRVYHYTWDDQRLQAAGNELMPECLELRDIFDLHLGPGSWQEFGPSPDEGGPFEQLLADLLRAQHYEVMCGVRALGKQIDVDIAVRAGNQYGIIEAKMGTKGRKLDGVKQLSTAVRLLGTYSRTFYVITLESDPRHKTLTEAASIDVISLPGYNATTNTLMPDDEAEFLARIKKALKG